MNDKKDSLSSNCIYLLQLGQMYSGENIMAVKVFNFTQILHRLEYVFWWWHFEMSLRGFRLYLCRHTAARCRRAGRMSGQAWSTRQPSRREVQRWPGDADSTQSPHPPDQRWSDSAACTSPLWTPGYWETQKLSYSHQLRPHSQQEVTATWVNNYQWKMLSVSKVGTGAVLISL